VILTTRNMTASDCFMIEYGRCQKIIVIDSHYIIIMKYIRKKMSIFRTQFIWSKLAINVAFQVIES